jgi:hypothetical protein
MATAVLPSARKSIASKVWREIARPFRRRPRGRSMTKTAAGPQVQSLFGSFDPSSCTVEPDGLPLLIDVVKESGRYPGPIVEIGTLLGITATHMALHKRAGQKIITVDNYSWNPWRLAPDKHFALTQQVLFYLVQSGHVEQVRQDKNEFFRMYSGPAPALVFVDAVHDYVETKKDIEWAQKAGAKIIAGHDYCPRFPGVMQIVDECGGPSRLSGTVWVL